ncbi:MAG: RHS repeat-associated core domain-containing protein [Thermodesulfobacteriota bacterium]
MDRHCYHLGHSFCKITKIKGVSQLDIAGNLLAEADGSNNITRYYIHGLGLVAMVTPSDEVYCYYYNATGSTVAMTDSSQTMVNKYAYDPFGKVTNQEEAIPQPFKFVGQYGVMTEPNGFCYMRARYYDPNVGRFISEDPIGFEGGDVNLYAYVGNNPVVLIDPLGEDWLYYQTSGRLSYLNNQTGVVTPIGTGYSGHGRGLNNPAMQNVPNVGPIPQGTYTIGAQQTNVTSSGTVLPGSMKLTPRSGTDTFGRSGFLIHGGNFSTMDSSRGCIILPSDIRNQIGRSGDTTLRVKP